MILIDDVLISDEIVEEHFVCDLHKCKGGCCVEGDAGAPLSEEELQKLEDVYDIVEEYLTPEGKAEIEKNGTYCYDAEFGFVTPVIANGMCAYGMIDENGIVKCALEKVFLEGKTNWKKPLSCHLFPIRVKTSKRGDLLNYEPRPGLCDPACVLGNSLKIPVYKFLKEPLIYKYGSDFYESLEASAIHIKSNK